jgi:hypothetical protein
MVSSRVILLALVVALPGVAGCGDDDGGSGGGGGYGANRPATTDTTTTVADACSLLEDAEVSARVGRAGAPDKRDGETLDGFTLSQCEWEGPDGEVAVAVVGSPARFEQHRDRGRGVPVPGLGDGAVVEQGTSLEDRGGTRGRTVFVLDGETTLVVALAHGREDVPADEVVALARAAHGRLG